MNEFKCKCVKCNHEQAYENLKAAYMDGWNFGKNAMCWDCQKASKAEYDPIAVVEIES